MSMATTEAEILTRIRAFGAAGGWADEPTGNGDAEHHARVERARRVLERAPADRIFAGPLSDTDMVDADVPGAVLPTEEEAEPEGPLAGRVRAAALSLPVLAEHPGIASEFERSLRKRARLWEPLVAAVLEELGREADEGVVRLVAAWFTLVHLSGPVDHWIDGDPQGAQWERHRPTDSFEIVLAIKDQALALPVSAVDASPRGTALALAAADLGSSAVTATMGSYFDLLGALEYRPGRREEEYAAIHEKLVQWKSACIYRALTRALAIAGGASPEVTAGLERFGEVTGYCIQVFDDAGGIWGDGGDLDKPSVALTFPLVYGLNLAHPGRDALRGELARGADRDRGRILSIADGIGALLFLEFLIEEGARECEAALAPLGERARAALLSWFHAYFRHQI